jgi:hypothetical protein
MSKGYQATKAGLLQSDKAEAVLIQAGRSAPEQNLRR